jgi:hypothetical protein
MKKIILLMFLSLGPLAQAQPVGKVGWTRAQFDSAYAGYKYFINSESGVVINDVIWLGQAGQLKVVFIRDSLFGWYWEIDPPSHKIKFIDVVEKEFKKKGLSTTRMYVNVNDELYFVPKKYTASTQGYRIKVDMEKVKIVVASASLENLSGMP